MRVTDYWRMALAVAAAVALSTAALAVEQGKVRIVGSDTVDFGSYPAAQRKLARYTLRNDGAGVLKIVNIRKTCGCASAVCDKAELQPGDQATVEVAILPNSIFGPYRKQTYVETSDTDNRFTTLLVAGNAIPLVKVTPQSFVYAGRLHTNEAWSCKFQLQGSDPGVRLGQPTVQCSFPVDCHLVEEAPPAGRYTLDVTVRPTAQGGDLKCALSLPVVFPTNQPPLILGVTGKIGAELNALPGTLFLEESAVPLKRGLRLRLLGATQRPLTPELVRLPVHAGVSLKVGRDPAAEGLTVEAEFAPAFAAEFARTNQIELHFQFFGASPARVVCRPASRGVSP